jgi:hypothetical protein
LPLRGQVLADISAALSENSGALDGLSLDDFTDIKLHYLDGFIQLELWRDLRVANNSTLKQSSEEYVRSLLSKPDYISGVEFVYHNTQK